MAAPERSLLGAGQMHKRTFDESNGAIRVVISEATQMQVALSAEDNDSVLVVSHQSQQKTTVTKDMSGIIIPEFSVAGLTKVSLYTNTTSSVEGSPYCEFQVSPSDTDDVWYTVTKFLTETYVAPITISARRARVKMDTPISNGSFDIYCVASQ